MTIISFLTSHKLSKIIFSKYFGFSFFSAKLQDVKAFFPFNVLLGISVIVTSLPIIGAAGLAAYDDVIKEQLFISSIDTIIVTVLMILFAICDTQKPGNYFEPEQNALNTTYHVKLNDTTAIDNSALVLDDKSILKKRQSDQSIPEFTELNKVYKSEDKERPFSEPLIQDETVVDKQDLDQYSNDVLDIDDGGSLSNRNNKNKIAPQIMQQEQ